MLEQQSKTNLKKKKESRTRDSIVGPETSGALNRFLQLFPLLCFFSGRA